MKSKEIKSVISGTQDSLLSAIINSSKDIVIFSLDKNYCYTAFNEKHRTEMKKVWNVDIELGISLLDCIQINELRQLAKQSMDKALSGKSFNEVQHQSELDIYYEFNWNPIFQNNDIIGITAFIRDITKQKRVDESLKESEEKYRTLIQKIQAAVIVHGRDTQIITCNAKAQELLGLTEDQLLGKTAIDPSWHFFNEDRNIMPQEEYPVNRVMVTRQELRDYIVGVHRPGRDDDIWALVNADPVFDNMGVINQVIVTFIDITQRKKAEEALRESEYKLGEAARIAHVGYWDRDLVAKTIFLSEEANLIFGLPENFRTPELSEWHVQWLKLIHPDDQQKTALAVTQALEGGPPYNVDYRVVRPDGDIRFIHSFAEVTKDGSGKPIRMFGTMIDITERKHAEETITNTARRLNEAQRLAHIGSWELDLINNVLTWSDEIYRIFEIDPEKFGATYEAFLDAIHPDDRKAVNLAYTNSLKTKTPYTIDHRLLFPNGRVKYVHEQCETYYDGDTPIRSIGTVQDITERQIAAEALKESEWRYREIFDNILDGLYLLEVTEDGRFRTIEVNPALEHLTGVPRSFSVGKTQEEIVPAEVAELVNAKYRRCVESGHPIEEEAILDLPVGRRNFHSTLIPSRDNTGRIHRIVGISRDITELKETEQRLKLLNFALNNVYDEAYLIDEKACFYYVNDESCRALGYSRTELLKMNVADIDPDFPLERWPEHWDGIREKGALVFEGRHKTKEGKIYPVEISANYFEYNGKGYNLALARDITERKLMDDTLFFVAQRGWQISREDFFDALAQFLGEKLDMEYVFIDKMNDNPEMAETVALYAKGEIAPNIQYPLKGTPCENVMGQKLCVYPKGIQQLFPDDSLLPGMNAESYIGIPLWDSTGRPIGLIAAVGTKPLIDCTPVAQMLQLVATRASAELERKRAQEEIRKLNQELEQRVIERTSQLQAANKELEAFAYSVSHDLRAPLRGIDGFSQMLLDEYKDKIDVQAINYLQRVCAAARRMSQLIDDMLSLSRINRAEMGIQRVNLSKIAQEIANSFCESQPDRQVEFIVAQEITAKGDGRLLRILLENLLGNAWKFTSKHPKARIEFGIQEQGGKSVYFVRDDGAGFDMNYAGKLFGAFQRLHDVKEFPGTGIGLVTVQRIIHRHGGNVWAEGEVEKGATFYFTIPNRIT